MNLSGLIKILNVKMDDKTDDKENFIKKIPGIEPEIIELMPSEYRRKIIQSTNDFFISHRIAKDNLNRCNFEGALMSFGESQQSKGRALCAIDAAYKEKLISVDMSNAINDYIHKFNDAKIRDLLDNIRKCELH